MLVVPHLEFVQSSVTQCNVIPTKYGGITNHANVLCSTSIVIESCAAFLVHHLSARLRTPYISHSKSSRAPRIVQLFSELYVCGQYTIIIVAEVGSPSSTMTPDVVEPGIKKRTAKYWLVIAPPYRIVRSIVAQLTGRRWRISPFRSA